MITLYMLLPPEKHTILDACITGESVGYLYRLKNTNQINMALGLLILTPQKKHPYRLMSVDIIYNNILLIPVSNRKCA